MRHKPELPPPGPPEYIEKGFPKHENPNWWQKIENWLFASKEVNHG